MNQTSRLSFRLRPRLAGALGGAVCALLALGASGVSAQSIQTDPHSPPHPQTWHGELGFGGYAYDGERVWAIEAGTLRHEPGNRSLGIGAHFLLAPESLVCVGLAPCPKGSLRLAAVGVNVERRFHLGKTKVGETQGATPAPSWLAPRVTLTMGRGGARTPVAEVGGALGHEVRLGGSAGLSMAVRAGMAATRSSGAIRTTGVFGLVAGIRWEL